MIKIIVEMDPLTGDVKLSSPIDPLTTGRILAQLVAQIFEAMQTQGGLVTPAGIAAVRSIKAGN